MIGIVDRLYDLEIPWFGGGQGNRIVGAAVVGVPDILIKASEGDDTGAAVNTDSEIIGTPCRAGDNASADV